MVSTMLSSHHLLLAIKNSLAVATPCENFAHLVGIFDERDAAHMFKQSGAVVSVLGS